MGTSSTHGGFCIATLITLLPNVVEWMEKIGKTGNNQPNQLHQAPQSQLSSIRAAIGMDIPGKSNESWKEQTSYTLVTVFH